MIFQGLKMPQKCWPIILIPWKITCREFQINLPILNTVQGPLHCLHFFLKNIFYSLFSSMTNGQMDKKSWSEAIWSQTIFKHFKTEIRINAIIRNHSVSSSFCPQEPCEMIQDRVKPSWIDSKQATVEVDPRELESNRSCFDIAPSLQGTRKNMQ